MKVCFSCHLDNPLLLVQACSHQVVLSYPHLNPTFSYFSSALHLVPIFQSSLCNSPSFTKYLLQVLCYICKEMACCSLISVGSWGIALAFRKCYLIFYGHNNRNHFRMDWLNKVGALCGELHKWCSLGLTYLYLSFAYNCSMICMRFAWTCCLLVKAVNVGYPLCPFLHRNKTLTSQT